MLDTRESGRRGAVFGVACMDRNVGEPPVARADEAHFDASNRSGSRVTPRAMCRLTGVQLDPNRLVRSQISLQGNANHPMTAFKYYGVGASAKDNLDLPGASRPETQYDSSDVSELRIQVRAGEPYTRLDDRTFPSPQLPGAMLE
jgi:hypothetical protein